MRKLNNKGFTLIELLAVIVILAIVMGVAANAVLNVMNDSRKNTLQSSAKSAADAFRTAYGEMQLKNEDTILGVANLVVSTGTSTQPLGNAAGKINITESNYDLTNSFVTYDSTTGAFKVCLVAKKGGSYWLDSAKSGVAKTIDGKTFAAGTMWACSDDQNSWTTSS